MVFLGGGGALSDERGAPLKFFGAWSAETSFSTWRRDFRDTSLGLYEVEIESIREMLARAADTGRSY